MPSCHSLILLLLYGARQACMVPPKAQRLPGSLDCTAEMFHGSGHKAAREADPRPLIVSVCQTGEGRGKRSKILAFVPFQCCLSPASCASETKPAPLTAKRRHLWTISFFFPFDFMVFLFLFFTLKNMGRNQRVSELVTMPTRHCAPNHPTPTNLGTERDLIFLRLAENPPRVEATSSEWIQHSRFCQ